MLSFLGFKTCYLSTVPGQSPDVLSGEKWSQGKVMRLEMEEELRDSQLSGSVSPGRVVGFYPHFSLPHGLRPAESYPRAARGVSAQGPSHQRAI